MPPLVGELVGVWCGHFSYGEIYYLVRCPEQLFQVLHLIGQGDVPYEGKSFRLCWLSMFDVG